MSNHVNELGGAPASIASDFALTVSNHVNTAETTTPLRIGCVPYLNAKPLIAWFHSTDCDIAADVRYVVPSQLAAELRAGTLDAALVSTFELFQNPGLRLVPGVSISADGPVKSVRLFSHAPFSRIRTVALDSSSLTSCALLRILLAEMYGIHPEYVSMPPNLDRMLAECDAGMIIGDLKLFETEGATLDLGDAWKRLTGLPFCYAAWLAQPGAPPQTDAVLLRAREWGCSRLEELAVEWAPLLGLPLDRVRDYFVHVMQYDLDEGKLCALQEFRARCQKHGLVDPAGAPSGAR